MLCLAKQDIFLFSVPIILFLVDRPTTARFSVAGFGAQAQAEDLRRCAVSLQPPTSTVGGFSYPTALLSLYLSGSISFACNLTTLAPRLLFCRCTEQQSASPSIFPATSQALTSLPHLIVQNSDRDISRHLVDQSAASNVLTLASLSSQGHPASAPWRVFFGRSMTGF